MKTNLLLALTSVFMAFALFAAKTAYAENYLPVMSHQMGCEDWGYNDARCPAYLPKLEGKAAFGEATRTLGAREAQCLIETNVTGNDWDFNSPVCNPQVIMGKAAFGEPTRTSETAVSLCLIDANINGNDWNFNDPRCPR